MDALLASALAAFLAGAIVHTIWERKARELRELISARESGLEAFRKLYEAEVRHGDWAKSHLEGAHATILELRREGFEVPTGPPKGDESRVNAPPLPSVVKDVLDQIAPGDPKLYSILQREAETALEKEDADPEAIAESITKGSDYSPYE